MPDNLDKLDEYMLGGTKSGYSAIFLEHALHPKNTGSLDVANASATEFSHDNNYVEIWLRVEDDTVVAASFWTDGCTTTIACGSMTTELVKGKSVSEAFQIMPEDIDAALGGISGEGCTCAKLAINSLRSALRDYLTFKREPWRRTYSRS